jgi:nucleoside-diphosphate-sugar epimerase
MKVCVLGANGFIGKNLIKGMSWVGVTRQVLDLIDQDAVERYFKTHKYDVVIHCVASIDQSNESTTYKNVMMFENVTRVFKGRLIYFSSGAALRGDPPRDPYGLSKWIIDKRIQTIDNAYSLRIWGCYGPGELPSRFSAVCKEKGHVLIEKDRYFDFVDIEYVRKIVFDYVHGYLTDKEYNIAHPEKFLLSQWAEKFGATWEIRDKDGLGEPYILKTSSVSKVR